MDLGLTEGKVKSKKRTKIVNPEVKYPIIIMDGPGGMVEVPFWDGSLE